MFEGVWVTLTNTHICILFTVDLAKYHTASIEINLHQKRGVENGWCRQHTHTHMYICHFDASHTKVLHFRLTQTMQKCCYLFQLIENTCVQ